MIVEVLGPDGVGKTTFAKALASALRQDGGKVVRYHHRTKVGLALDGSSEPLLRSVAKPRNRLTVALKGLALWRSSVHRKRTIQIRERFFTDLRVSPQSYRIDERDVPLVMALRNFPQRREVRVLLLDDPAKIHQRKPELTESEISGLLEKFHLQVGMGHQFDLEVRISDDRDTQMRQVAECAKFIHVLSIAKIVPHPRRSIFVAQGPNLRQSSRRALVSSTKGKAWWWLTTLVHTSRPNRTNRLGQVESMTTFYKSHASRRFIILHSPFHRGTTDVDSSAELVQVVCGSYDEAERERRVLDLLSVVNPPFETLFRGSGSRISSEETSSPSPQELGAAVIFDLPNSLFFGYAPRTRDAFLEEVIGALKAFRLLKPGHILIHNDFTYWNFFGSAHGAVLLDCGQADLLKIDEIADHQLLLDVFSYVGSLGARSRRISDRDQIRALCEEICKRVYFENTKLSSSTLEEVASVIEKKFRLEGRFDLSTGLCRVFGHLRGTT